MATSQQQAVTAELAERVLSEVEAGREELLGTISRAVQIPSVNPRYPGQIYDEVVGGEGCVSQLVAEVYQQMDADVDEIGRAHV